MMKKTTLLLFMTMIVLGAVGQEPPEGTRMYKNHLTLELGGAGVAGSINYERMILGGPVSKTLFRIGASYLPFYVNNQAAFGTLIAPVGFYQLFGRRHHLELGLNATLGYTINDIEDENYLYYGGFASIGYRFENFFKRSTFFSIAYSPGYMYSVDEDEHEFNHWFKIGIGYSF